MPNTIDYKFGDIILVSFPFTDQITSKKRPAVVISTDAYHAARRDVIIMAVTSQHSRSADAVGEAAIRDWQQAGLLKPSFIKPVVATIERPLVLRRLGALADVDVAALRAAIRHAIG